MSVLERKFRDKNAKGVTYKLMEKHIVENDSYFKELDYWVQESKSDGGKKYKKEHTSVDNVLEDNTQRISNLFSLLDDIVYYYNRIDENSPFVGFWSRFEIKEYTKNNGPSHMGYSEKGYSESPFDPIMVSLQQFENQLQRILYIIGAEEYLKDKHATGDKYTLGKMLYDQRLKSILKNADGESIGIHSDKDEVKKVFDELLVLRNAITHDPIDEDGFNEIIKKSTEESFNEWNRRSSFVLVAFLHVVDWHYDELDRAIIAKLSTLPPSSKDLEMETAAIVLDEDPAEIRRRYVQYQKAETVSLLRKNVGIIGRVSNTSELRLMNLHLSLSWKDGSKMSFEIADEEGIEYAPDKYLFDLRHVTDLPGRVNVILGNPGSGKSTLLLHLRDRLCNQWLYDYGDSSMLPVTINLKDVNCRDFDDILRNKLGQSNYAAISPLFQEKGKVAFILDGLNELPVMDQKDHTFIKSLLETMRSRYPLCRYYLTGRIHEFERNGSDFYDLEECDIYHLREISQDDIIHYFKELGGQAEKNAFLSWVSEAGMEKLLSSPLNFSMIARLVLVGEDSGVLDRIHNRGELLDVFLKSILKDRGDITKEMDPETFILLQGIAIEFDNNGGHPVSFPDCMALFGKLHQDMDSVMLGVYLAKILTSLCNLDILTESRDVNAYPYYSFSIDTFQEYFLARSIAVDYVSGGASPDVTRLLRDCYKGSLASVVSTRFEMARLVLELTDGGCLDPESATETGLRMVKEFKDELKDNISVLAKLVTNLRDDHEARKWVESVVLKEMVTYRERHKVPDMEKDEIWLLGIVGAAVMLSGDMVLAELFNLYWMSLTGIVSASEFGFSFSEARRPGFRKELIMNCSDPVKFYDLLHESCLALKSLYPGSLSCLNATRNYLYSELISYKQKILYDHIITTYNKSSELYSGPFKDHFLLQDAYLLLLHIDDPEYIIGRIDLMQMLEAKVEISSTTLWSLLRNYRDDGICQLIFQQDFLCLLKAKNEEERVHKILMILRFYLSKFSADFRPQALLDYLDPSKQNGLMSLAPKYQQTILDMLPISELKPYAEKRFDSSLFDFLSESDEEEESMEGLHYRAFEYGDNTLKVWIRDISSDLQGTTAEVNGSRMAVVSDERVICRLFRFRFTSAEIIPITGSIVVGDKRIRYAVPAADTEIVISVFDKSLALFLSENSLVRLNDALSCRVEKVDETAPKSWRVLTFATQEIIPYSGDVRFLRNGEYVDIDKTIRPESYRYNPDLFRKVMEQADSSNDAARFSLLGCSESVAWLVTGSLDGDGFGKNVKEGVWLRDACSRELIGRFREVRPFLTGFIELTFRSYIANVFKENGELSVKLKGTDEEFTIPYVFCYCKGTRCVVRIINPVFVDQIAIREKRQVYMESSYRIGKIMLTLDYVELFPGSERLALWSVERVPEGFLPREGLLEVAEDKSFSKTQIPSFEEMTFGQAILSDSKCVFYNPDTSKAVFFVKVTVGVVMPGLFLEFENKAVHLKVLDVKRVKWSAELPCSTNYRVSMPGHLIIRGLDGDFLYQIIPSSKMFLVFSIGDTDFEVFKKAWNETERATFITDEGKVIDTGFKQKDSPVLLGVNQELVETDVPMGFIPQIGSCDDLYLTLLQPVRNGYGKSYDSVNRTIKTHIIPYTVNGNRICFRKPDTDISHNWVKFERSESYYALEIKSTQRENEFNIEYCEAELKSDKALPLRKKSKGKFGFYRKDGDRFIPIQVGYDRVLEVVDLSSPANYPAQICDFLVKELSGLDAINEKMVKFFIDHSRSYMLLKDPNLLKKIQSFSFNAPCFNLCTLTSKEGESIRTYSWLLKCVLESQDYPDTQIESGDLLLMEKNHKVTIINPADAVGSGFPLVGEESPLTQYCYDVRATTWQMEQERIDRFNAELSRICDFFFSSGNTLSIKKPEKGRISDSSGVIAVCDELPDFSFRLRGMSEASFARFMSGETIDVLPYIPVNKRGLFNPYMFSLKRYIFVVDASIGCPREGQRYYCIVSRINEKDGQRTSFGIILGDYLGHLPYTGNEQIRIGDLVQLQLNRSDISLKALQFKLPSCDKRLEEFNIEVGDRLDVTVSNNGPGGGDIFVELIIEGNVFPGKIDNTTVPCFSSRRLNGEFGLGTLIRAAIVKDLNYERDEILFELSDKGVSYPFVPGRYDCIVSRRYLDVFNWLKGVIWAIFKYDERIFTVEIPEKEWIALNTDDNSLNFPEAMLSYDQELPACIEIVGFTEFGDPLIRWNSLNEERLRELMDKQEPFLARIIQTDFKEQKAMWLANGTYGIAEFKKTVRTDGHYFISSSGKDNCPFYIYDPSIYHGTLNQGTIITALFHHDSSYFRVKAPRNKDEVRKTSFLYEYYLAEILQFGEENNNSVNVPVLCRHKSKGSLPSYWIEYLVSLGRPIKATVVRKNHVVHIVDFLPDIDFHWGNLSMEKGGLYDVKVLCYTENFIILEYDREDGGGKVIGAIEATAMDSSRVWREKNYPIGSLHRMRLVGFSEHGHSLYFIPVTRLHYALPEDGSEVEAKITEIGARGNVFFEVLDNEAVRQVVFPRNADRTILPSGKSRLRPGDIRNYKIHKPEQGGLQFQLTGFIWNKEHVPFSTRNSYLVEIVNVDEQDVCVRYNDFYGEIPTSDFGLSVRDISEKVGEKIRARISLINNYTRVIAFTLKDAWSLPLAKDNEVLDFHQLSRGDTICARVSGYADEYTPMLEWGQYHMKVAPGHAAILIGMPWLDQIDAKELMPVGTEYRVMVEEIDDNLMLKVHPCMVDVFADADEITANVLKCTPGGVYAKAIQSENEGGLLFIPKEELSWGRVFSAEDYFAVGESINVVKASISGVRAFLSGASYREQFVRPQVTMEAFSRVKVKILRILPHVIEVTCEQKQKSLGKKILTIQIPEEQTTWHPSYMLDSEGPLSERFSIADELDATVENGGTDNQISLSLRSLVNPWEFGQLKEGDRWPATVLNISADGDHFIAECRGLFVRVNCTGTFPKKGTQVEILINEVDTKAPFADAEFIRPIEQCLATPSLSSTSDSMPLSIGEVIQARIIKIHHPLLSGDESSCIDIVPMDWAQLKGTVPENELAWRNEDRTVDSYRVGDEVTVKIIDVDFRKESFVASIREVVSNDPRDISEIEAREFLTVKIERCLKLPDVRNSQKTICRVMFCYGMQHGSINMNEDIWRRIQDPEHFFRLGRMLRVQFIGFTEAKDNALYMKAIIPGLWKKSLIDAKVMVGLEQDVKVIYILRDSLFVLFFGCIVHMNRNQVLWEPTVPLFDIFKEGQPLPVKIEDVQPESLLIRLNARCLRKDPFGESGSESPLVLGKIVEGKVVSITSKRYYVDVDGVICVFPESGFMYPGFHKRYKKGDTIKAVVEKINTREREIILGHDNPALSSEEKDFMVGYYEWFTVCDYAKEGIILDHEGYEAVLPWKDAMLKGVNDITDMYPLGARCLLKVSCPKGGKMYVAASYDWSTGIHDLKKGTEYTAEICLCNPFTGIVLRAEIGKTRQCFCMLRRDSIVMPLIPGILQYPTGRKITVIAHQVIQNRMVMIFPSGVVQPTREELTIPKGMVVSGTVARQTDAYVIVQHGHVNILVERQYLSQTHADGDGVNVRITQNDSFEANGTIICTKLVGSEMAVHNNPERELPVGRKVSGVIVSRGKNEWGLKVEVPNKGTVVDKLDTKGLETSYYRGQRIIAFVDAHDYEKQKVVFSPFRPNPEELRLGSLMKCVVKKVVEDKVEVLTTFRNGKRSIMVPIQAFYWGPKIVPLPPVLEGDKFDMAVTAINRDGEPQGLTYRAMMPDLRSLHDKVVSARIVGHDVANERCLVMAGATLGYLPLEEMSYQRCVLWQQMFPLGETFKLAIMRENPAFPGMALFSYRHVHDNPFGKTFNITLFKQMQHEGVIVRADATKAVARVEEQIEVIIPSLDAFSDSIHTIIPEPGTPVSVRITLADFINGKYFEAKVIQ